MALNSTLQIASEMTYKNNKKVALSLPIKERDQIARDFLVSDS